MPTEKAAERKYLMFDTMMIGKKIAELRKRKNLTQPELADAMGVSFQAVSNWERGNSMPDISKLSDLAELLGTTVDDLLGKKNTVVEKLAKNEKVDLSGVRKEELLEAAEIAKPHVVEEMTEDANEKDIAVLLPFLGEEYLEKLSGRYYTEGKDIAMVLPFLSEEGVDRLFERAVADDCEDIGKFLPFISKEKLSDTAFTYKRAKKNISAFLPFLDDENINTLVTETLNNEGIKAILPFLPFLGEKDAEALAEKILRTREADKS